MSERAVARRVAALMVLAAAVTRTCFGSACSHSSRSRWPRSTLCTRFRMKKAAIVSRRPSRVMDARSFQLRQLYVPYGAGTPTRRTGTRSSEVRVLPSARSTSVMQIRCPICKVSCPRHRHCRLPGWGDARSPERAGCMCRALMRAPQLGWLVSDRDGENFRGALGADTSSRARARPAVGAAQKPRWGYQEAIIIGVTAPPPRGRTPVIVARIPHPIKCLLLLGEQVFR